MPRALFGQVVASLLLSVGLATAQPPGAATASGAGAAARQDPLGVKGISPAREAVSRGDRAFLKRDFELALVAYQDAISKDAHYALAYYRMGEAELERGDVPKADEAFTSGLREVSASDAALKAKLLFALADVRERQKAWDEASAAWTDYEGFATQQKTGFPASGSERKRAVDAWKKLSADSTEVKARIEKGIAAADEAVKKSSK